MGQQNASGSGKDGDSLVQAITAINNSKRMIQVYEEFRMSAVDGWIGVSEGVVQQHHALHLALDMCYKSRDVLVRDPSAINLIDALETAVLANCDIMTKVTDFLSNLDMLSKRMEDIG